MPTPPPVQQVIQVFEHLTAADLPAVGALYACEASFKDPFNDVRGRPAIVRVFEHMFAVLDEPRFTIVDVVAGDGQCFLSWDFRFRLRRWRADELCIHGGTHLIFDADGRILRHRDYWDAAEELYERLPAVGVLMRWLKRRAGS